MYLHLQFKKNIFDALQTIRSRKGYAGNKRKKYNSWGWKWVQYLHRAKKNWWLSWPILGHEWTLKILMISGKDSYINLSFGQLKHETNEIKLYLVYY